MNLCDEIKAVWNRRPHDAEIAAMDGCEDNGFDASFLSPDEWLSVLNASFDALPRGIDAAREAARERMRSEAIANGWDGLLYE